MKLNQFITDVLQDIDSGLKAAKDKTGRSYQVETSNTRGVHFDIAVTAQNSSSSSAEGEARAGFIEVLGAEVGAKLENKNENSEVSRIQFSVYVPSQTDQEKQAERARIEAAREERKRENENQWGIA